MKKKKSGSTEIWTRIAGFRVQSANHYTIEPPVCVGVCILFCFFQRQSITRSCSASARSLAEVHWVRWTWRFRREKPSVGKQRTKPLGCCGSANSQPCVSKKKKKKKKKTWLIVHVADLSSCPAGSASWRTFRQNVIICTQSLEMLKLGTVLLAQVDNSSWPLVTRNDKSFDIRKNVQTVYIQTALHMAGVGQIHKLILGGWRIF